MHGFKSFLRSFLTAISEIFSTSCENIMFINFFNHFLYRRSPITALSPPLDVPRLLELDITRPQAGGTPRIGGARLVRTEEARIRSELKNAKLAETSNKQNSRK